MSIATVVSRGFGSFGSIDLVPTRGYSIAAGVVDVQGCGCLETELPSGTLETVIVNSELSKHLTSGTLEVIECEGC